MDIYLTSSIRREELVQRLGEMAGQDPPVPPKVEPESELSVEGSPKNADRCSPEPSAAW